MIMDRIALIISIIGALNWGSIGLFGFDCVAFLCGVGVGTDCVHRRGAGGYLVHLASVPDKGNL